MENLSIDIETYSSADLSKCGVYKYAEADDFDILLFGYSIDHGEVRVADLAQGEKLTDEVLEALTDKHVTKWAYNAQFERVCISAWLKKNYPERFKSYSIDTDSVGNYLDPASWRCSMVWASYMGLPRSLEGVGAVLGLSEQKLKEGKELIRYFCLPCRATKSNGGRTRNRPVDAMDKWELFKTYNRRDVEVELAIQAKLASFPVPARGWKEYRLDQEINDRGILVDMQLVDNAIAFDAKAKGVLAEKLKNITNLENPNSVQQMKNWLTEHGLTLESLGKKDVAAILKTAEEPLRTVLLLRQQLAKSSVKKYQAMQNAVCKDNRARGMFQFYGASRSGRFSGKLIQLQNLPQNHLPDLSEARSLVRQGNYEALELLYEDVPDTLSQLIRTAFVSREGKKYIVADFSAIEARVIAWLAGETWKSQAFADGKDIYCSTASQMFGVPVVKHGINGELRQKGKITELACGYGGSVGALIAMGALEMGLAEDELKPLVDMWRNANPNIVQLWWDVDEAVKTAVKGHTTTDTHGIEFEYRSGMLFITLPSGRKLSYVRPRMGENRFGGEAVLYEGTGTTKKWELIESYGPKFVENIVQAIARDILCYAMDTLSCCYIVGHVHDELIIECENTTSLKAVCRQMGRTPPWAKGLLLRADGYECKFYKKD